MQTNAPTVRTYISQNIQHWSYELYVMRNNTQPVQKMGMDCYKKDEELTCGIFSMKLNKVYNGNQYFKLMYQHGILKG